MIGVFAAMTPEVSACFGPGAQREETAVAGYTVLLGNGYFVCKTGIGRGASVVAEAVVEAMSPEAVVSVGVCGGLAPGLAIGELVVARHVDHEEHRRATEQMSIYCHEQLVEAALEAAREADIAASAGTCLTVDEAAWGPAEKAALHSWKAHDIVEMESFWVGRAAARHGLPFAATRSVSDSAHDTLFQTGAMKPDGTFDGEALQAWIAANPQLVGEYAAQAERARTALVNLARFLAVYLPALCRVDSMRGRKE